jgi:hypothetical protein
MDTRPYTKFLILGVSAFDYTTMYIPEVLHLLLFILTLFYFFSLIFRFNEIFGQEDVENLVEQL